MLTVINRKPQFFNLGGHLVLKPGVNEVVDDLWDKALEIFAVRSLVEDGTFTVEKRSLKDLSRLKPAAAAELVKVTYDKDLLQRWANAERRSAIANLIAQQIDAVTPKAGEGDKAKDTTTAVASSGDDEV